MVKKTTRIVLGILFVGSILFLGTPVDINKSVNESAGVGLNAPSPAEDMSNVESMESPNESVKKPDFNLTKDMEFPPEFLFGTAYSDFQTAGVSPTSDWYEFTGKLKPPYVGSGIANDFYNRYKEDFDLAAEFHDQIHRISLDWSRLEPEQGKYDMKMVALYRNIFRYMKSRGVEPMICSNHFPHPKWFAEIGGWENPEAPKLYARYNEFLAKEFGLPLDIGWWLTFNEPQFVVTVPYVKGERGWPPFKELKNYSDTEGIERIMKVAGHVMDGHRLSFRAIHRVLDNKIDKKVMVGVASAPGAFYPNDPDSPLDKMASNLLEVLYTQTFDRFIGNSDRDFIGLNYYGVTKMKLHISLGSKVLSWLTESEPFNLEWKTDSTTVPNSKKFHPGALYSMIMKFKDTGLPIFITENGIDDGEDKFREEFLVVHLAAVHKAIGDGANVIGYQYWALADTWEPGDYRFSEMGMIKIDRENNLKRSLRPSASVYGEIIETHKIKKELLKKHERFLK